MGRQRTRSASRRTFFGKSKANDRGTGPWALPPPFQMGERMDPWRARPEPFWRHGFAPPPETVTGNMKYTGNMTYLNMIHCMRTVYLDIRHPSTGHAAHAIVQPRHTDRDILHDGHSCGCLWVWSVAHGRWCVRWQAGMRVNLCVWRVLVGGVSSACSPPSSPRSG